jgi:hypothetical protein
MRYLCLIYVDEASLDQTPADVVEAVGSECLAHTEELRRDGRLIACERLESVQTATTVRSRNGRVSVTDGPFAETKEQLAGFYLIEARDLNEAIRVASHIPPGRFGSIEVRPVMAGPSG